MAKATTAATKRVRTRPRRKAREGPVWYVVEIEDWEWSFSFGVNWPKDDPDPFSDFRHVHLTGTLRRPSKLKADEARVILLPDETYNRDQRARHRGRPVGSASLYGGRFEALCPMPADMLSPLLTMLTAGKIKYVVLQGAKLRYGRGQHHYSLEMTMNEDDLPSE